jgi:hypothetical protein
MFRAIAWQCPPDPVGKLRPIHLHAVGLLLAL